MNSPHHPDYIRLSYERGMLSAMVRLIEEEFLPTDTCDTAKTKIFCENLARECSEIPRESWLALVTKFERMIRTRAIDMSRFVQIDRGLLNEKNEEDSEIIGAEEEDNAGSGNGEAGSSESNSGSTVGTGSQPSAAQGKTGSTRKVSR